MHLRGVHRRHPILEVDVIDGPREDVSLALDDFLHPLVDGVLRQQLDELAVASLSQPQEATRRLREVRRGPGQVEEVGVAGGRQVDAHTTSLDAKAQQTDLTRLETIHDAEPVLVVDRAGDHLRTGPLLALVVDSRLVGEVADQRQDGIVIGREQHHLLTRAESLIDEMDGLGDLAVSRKLAQVVQLGQRTTTLCGGQLFLADSLSHQPRDEIGFRLIIRGAVGQLDPRLTDLPLGGILPDLVRQTTHHKLLEFLRQFLLTILRPIHLHEVLLRGIGPGAAAHLEERVKLPHPVDQGRCGHHHRMTSEMGEHHRHRRPHRIRVADHVALIRDEDTPLGLDDLGQGPRSEPLEVGVADDDDIEGVDVAGVVGITDAHRQMRAHLDLALPEMHQALGAGDHSLVALGGQVGRYLNGLAKPGVIC